MLTHTQCINAKSKLKPYKLAAGGSLYLHVMPNGSKLWKYKFTFDGKEKLMSLGRFPEISLAQALEMHREARALTVEQIFYSVKETCRLLGCGHTTFYKHANTGALEVLKMGGKTVVHRDEILRFSTSQSPFKRSHHAG